MLLGLRAVGSALAQVLTHVTASLLGNLLAILLSIPLLLLVGILAFSTRSFSLIPLGVAFLVGVLPNPCTAGVQLVARKLATADYVSAGDQWAGLRSYARPAAGCWLLSLAVSVLMLVNIAFYARSMGTASSIPHVVVLPLLLLWVLLFAFWISIQLYIFPLLIAQEVKSMRLIYRNATLMVIARPSVSAVVIPVWLAVLLFSSATGLATFIGLALGAAIQHNAAAKLLPTFRMGPAG